MKKKKKTPKALLEEEVLRLSKLLSQTDPTSDEYKNINDRINQIQKTLDRQKFKIDPNTIAVIIGNLLISGLVIKSEEFQVLTSKCLQFLVRRTK